MNVVCSQCGSEIEVDSGGDPIFDDDAVIQDGAAVCGDCLREDGELDVDDEELAEGIG